MTSSSMSDRPTVSGQTYFRQLCEHLGVAVIAVDVHLDIRFWNAAAVRIFGAGAERMIGTPIASIVPQQRRNEAERILRRAVETGETTSFEFEHPDLNGHRRQLIVTVAPVPDESGVRIGASACIRDITRRVKLQAELSESRKMSALGALAGAIAHHFNNILGGVITSVDYAAAARDPALTTRVLGQTSHALLRATTLVNGLLAFSEGDQRPGDLRDFTEIVHELADEIGRTSAEKRISFTLNLPALPVLSLPRVQVQTVLRNIIQNAIEAMPDGGTLKIDVSLERDRVVTCISDTGCGLDEAAVARVFEPFWSTKPNPGTQGETAPGLGLAIAHGLVQVLGGSICVSSEPAKGSCFKVSLPRPHTE